MLQGLVISLPYCYLNTEVQSVVRTQYRRWQLIRTVGTGRMSGDKYFYRIFKQFCSLSIIFRRPRQQLTLLTLALLTRQTATRYHQTKMVSSATTHNVSDVSE